MNAMVRQFGVALAMGLLACAMAAVGADGEPACPALYAGGTVAFTGLFPAIEGRMDVSNFRPGQIVEIDPATMPEADAR